MPMDVYRIIMLDHPGVPHKLVVGKIGATFAKGRGQETTDLRHVRYAQERPSQFSVVNLSKIPVKNPEPAPPREIVVPITQLDAAQKPFGDALPANKGKSDFAIAGESHDDIVDEEEEAPEPIVVGMDDALDSSLDDFPEFVAWEKLTSGKKPTVPQLTAFATEWGIDLGDAKLKDEIVSKIEAAIEETMGSEEA